MGVELDEGEVVLTEGVWFDGDYAFFVKEFLKDGGGKVGPERSYIIKLIEKIEFLGFRHRKLACWLVANPVEEDGSVDWWDDFAEQCVIHAGWNLLWRGKLYTGETQIEGVVETLRSHLDVICRLGWPEDAKVVVQVQGETIVGESRTSIRSSNVPPIRWGDLIGGSEANLENPNPMHSLSFGNPETKQGCDEGSTYQTAPDVQRDQQEFFSEAWRSIRSTLVLLLQPFTEASEALQRGELPKKENLRDLFLELTHPFSEQCSLACATLARAATVVPEVDYAECHAIRPTGSDDRSACPAWTRGLGNCGSRGLGCESKGFGGWWAARVSVLHEGQRQIPHHHRGRPLANHHPHAGGLLTGTLGTISSASERPLSGRSLAALGGAVGVMVSPRGPSAVNQRLELKTARQKQSHSRPCLP